MFAEKMADNARPSVTGEETAATSHEEELDTNTEILPRETSYCNCKTGCTTGTVYDGVYTFS